MRWLVRVSKTRRTRRSADTFLIQQDQQGFGFGTVEETVGGVRQPLTGYRPRAEDFVFAERVEGVGGDDSDGDGVADGIEDLD